jgi:hypothetical protein
VEQQLAATLGKWQIAQFVEDHQVDACQPVGDAAGPTELDLGLELVDEIDDVEEALAEVDRLRIEAMSEEDDD